MYEIEALFLPKKNNELNEHLKNPLQMDAKYFELARKVLVRIHESIEQWTKDFGSDGYFNFISKYIKGEITNNNNYLVEPIYLKD